MLKCYFFMNLFCEPFPCICFMYLYCILIVFVLYSSVSAGRSIGGERSQTQTLSLNLTSPWHLYLPWNLHSNFSNYTNRNYTNRKKYILLRKEIHHHDIFISPTFHSSQQFISTLLPSHFFIWMLYQQMRCLQHWRNKFNVNFLEKLKKRLLMFPPGSEDNQNMLLHLFLIWRILFLILAKICFWFQTDQGEVEFGGCCDAQLVIPDKDQKALQSWYMQIWTLNLF